MWRKQKIDIEKKNNRTKNPPISTQVIQKKSALSFNPDIPKPKEKNKQQTWKNTKNTMKKMKESMLLFMYQTYIERKEKKWKQRKY